MRRSQCEVKNPEEIVAILKRCTIGRLATLGADGFPYITPVNYVYWQESVYFHCSHRGEKMENIRRDSRVCFEVDIPLAYKERACDPEAAPCSVHQFYHSVIIRGRAEIVTDSAEKVGALNALMASHEKNPHYGEIQADMPEVAACSVVAVRVATMTGKSDLGQKKSVEEKAMIADFLRRRNLPGDVEAGNLMCPDK